MMQQTGRGWISLIAVVALLVGGCSSDADRQEELLTLERSIARELVEDLPDAQVVRGFDRGVVARVDISFVDVDADHPACEAVMDVEVLPPSDAIRTPAEWATPVGCDVGAVFDSNSTYLVERQGERCSIDAAYPRISGKSVRLSIAVECG